MRVASSAASKQSPGERGAITGIGASPLRPNIACSRSDCSVLVGRPVEGPPRCTSTTTSGSSVITARPRASDFSETPGPDVVVTPSAPPKEAPIAALIPAISSSAWKVRTPKALCQRLVAGDVAVAAGRHRGRLDLVGDGEGLGRLAVVVAGAERGDVGRGDLGLAAEGALEEADRALGGPVVHPGQQPAGEQ